MIAKFTVIQNCAVMADKSGAFIRYWPLSAPFLGRMNGRKEAWFRVNENNHSFEIEDEVSQ